jgi:hypothetical protein
MAGNERIHNLKCILLVNWIYHTKSESVLFLCEYQKSLKTIVYNWVSGPKWPFEFLFTCCEYIKAKCNRKSHIKYWYWSFLVFIKIVGLPLIIACLAANISERSFSRPRDLTIMIKARTQVTPIKVNFMTRLRLNWTTLILDSENIFYIKH